MSEKEFNILCSSEKAKHLLSKSEYEPWEKIAFYYLDYNKEKWIAVDNRTGKCWIEEFQTETEAHKFLFKEEED